MKIDELRQNSEAELKKKLAEFKKEMFNLRFQKVYSSLSNTARVRQVRRGIARVLTLLNERKGS